MVGDTMTRVLGGDMMKLGGGDIGSTIGITVKGEETTDDRDIREQEDKSEGNSCLKDKVSLGGDSKEFAGGVMSTFTLLGEEKTEEGNNC